MARLILSLDGQTLAEYNMTKERYTVGRLPDNDIRIDIFIVFQCQKFPRPTDPSLYFIRNKEGFVLST